MFLLQDAASLALMMPFFSRMALFDLRSTQPGFTSGCDTYTLNLPERASASVRGRSLAAAAITRRG